MPDGALTQPPEVLARVAPDAAEAFERMEVLALDVVDPTVLELVRLRMAQLLGDVRGAERRSARAADQGLTEEKIADLSRWPIADEFSPLERACLALAEQYVIDVSMVSDADTSPVLEHLGPAGLLGFVQALWVVDESIRLDLALGALAFDADEQEAQS